VIKGVAVMSPLFSAGKHFLNVDVLGWLFVPEGLSVHAFHEVISL
jgi:hypothetical protein